MKTKNVIPPNSINLSALEDLSPEGRERREREIAHLRALILEGMTSEPELVADDAFFAALRARIDAE